MERIKLPAALALQLRADDPLEVLRAQRARLMRHPQALGEQKVQLVAEPLAPVAQVRALVREGVLEKLLPGEVLEIGVVDPALAESAKMCLSTKRVSIPGRPLSA